MLIDNYIYSQPNKSIYKWNNAIVKLFFAFYRIIALRLTWFYFLHNNSCIVFFVLHHNILESFDYDVIVIIKGIPVITITYEDNYIGIPN